MAMRSLLIAFLLLPAAFAHVGEEAEQHSALDTLLDNPAAIAAAFLIFIISSYAFHTLFPMRKRHLRSFQITAGLIALAFIILIALSLSRAFFAEPSGPAPYHTHADFKVYLNGTAFDFAQARYMSSKDHVVNSRVHLHDLDGDVIHHHARNVTMGEFFSSLGMSYNSTCFITDEDSAFCDDGANELRMFVMHHGGAWKEEPSREAYVFSDLDRILITYGDPGDPISGQLSSVTDKACIQSEECPERGAPSDESSCAGDVCNV